MKVIRGIVACLLAGVLACSGSVATAATAPLPPSSDPFYTYTGPLHPFAPGTVLRVRQTQVSLGSGTPQVYPATQVLYRTTNQLGKASATVATIISPAVATGPVKLLSYQTFYDGVADTCRPSYTLQGGGAASSTGSVDESLMLSYLAEGYTVVTSDYEGETDDFGAGVEEGQNTLDAIRAAEDELGVPSQTPVGLLGYSGGSIATEWASELAPTYAPELHLIAVAEGGIPVDFAHNLTYINGSSDWAGAMPAILIGLARAYKVHLDKYLSPEGVQITDAVAQGCLDPTAYPGLQFSAMLKPQYQDYFKVPLFVRLFNDSIMGRSSAPQEPLLMGVGDADGTGDGVMIAGDVQQLAYQYCQQGVSTEFNAFDGLNHYEAIAPFESEAQTFLNAAYAGVPAVSGCSTITPGNPLTPLPSKGS